jgi:hypothetical protein
MLDARTAAYPVSNQAELLKQPIDEAHPGLKIQRAPRPPNEESGNGN